MRKHVLAIGVLVVVIASFVAGALLWPDPVPRNVRTGSQSVDMTFGLMDESIRRDRILSDDPTEQTFGLVTYLYAAHSLTTPDVDDLLYFAGHKKMNNYEGAGTVANILYLGRGVAEPVVVRYVDAVVSGERQVPHPDQVYRVAWLCLPRIEASYKEAFRHHDTSIEVDLSTLRRIVASRGVREE